MTVTLEAPAVPPSVTSEPTKFVTGSLKRVAKWTEKVDRRVDLAGGLVDGHGWAAVDVLTMLSNEVDERLGCRLRLARRSGEIVGMTVPPPSVPATLTVNVLLSREETVTVFVPTELPPTTTSLLVKSRTGSLNVAVKRIGPVPVGSA